MEQLCKGTSIEGNRSNFMYKIKISIIITIIVVAMSLKVARASLEPLPQMCSTIIYGMKYSSPPSEVQLDKSRNYFVCISGRAGHIAVRQSMSQENMNVLNAVIEYENGTVYAFNIRLVGKRYCDNLEKTKKNIKRINDGLLAIGCVTPIYLNRNGEYDLDQDIQALYAASVINKNKEISIEFLRYFSIKIGTKRNIFQDYDENKKQKKVQGK